MMTGIILGFVAALCIHEEGHWVAARLLGYKARFVLRWAGPGTWWSADETTPRGDRFLVSAAGPLANIVFAVEATGMGWTTLALVSLVVGASQLVPLGPSDGNNMLRALRGQVR